MNAPRALANDDVPRIAPGHRMQFEPAQDCHVLLYPEGMVTLNASAAAILERCDGQRRVEAVCAAVSDAFDGAEVAADVHEFLALALHRGWITKV